MLPRTVISKFSFASVDIKIQDCNMEETVVVDPAVGDVTESIAFGLLNDAEKLAQVRIFRLHLT